MAIRERKLGNQGLVVSELALGCMGMSEFYGPADEAESIATLHRALDLGVNLIDTADMYGPFTNEVLVGRALRGLRDRVILATKFGNQRQPDGTYVRVNGRPEYVKSACDASLLRLGVEHIDLYYQHRVDPTVPIEETVGAMAELKRAGKIRYLGLSEAGPATIRRAQLEHPISALQSECSLWTREVETEIFPVIRELGIGFVAYSPLGRGFLTGRFRSREDMDSGDIRRRVHPRFQAGNFEKNLALARAVEELASKKGCSPAQLALAWVLGQGTDIVALFGARRRAHLEDNLGAVSVELTPQDRGRLDEIFPPGAAAGLRYVAEQMKRVGI